MNQQDVIKRFTDMQRVLHDAQQEIATLPEALQAGAQQIINRACDRYAEIRAAWETICTSTTVTPTTCESFCRQLDTAISPPHKLILRRIHCNNLQRLEQQQVSLPATLPAGTLQTLLAPSFAHTQQQIVELEQRQPRAGYEQELVSIHRNNLMMLQGNACRYSAVCTDLVLERPTSRTTSDCHD